MRILQPGHFTIRCNKLQIFHITNMLILQTLDFQEYKCWLSFRVVFAIWTGNNRITSHKDTNLCCLHNLGVHSRCMRFTTHAIFYRLCSTKLSAKLNTVYHSCFVTCISSWLLMESGEFDIVKSKHISLTGAEFLSQMKMNLQHLHVIFAVCRTAHQIRAVKILVNQNLAFSFSR